MYTQSRACMEGNYYVTFEFELISTLFFVGSIFYALNEMKEKIFLDNFIVERSAVFLSKKKIEEKRE